MVSPAIGGRIAWSAFYGLRWCAVRMALAAVEAPAGSIRRSACRSVLSVLREMLLPLGERLDRACRDAQGLNHKAARAIENTIAAHRTFAGQGIESGWDVLFASRITCGPSGKSGSAWRHSSTLRHVTFVTTFGLSGARTLPRSQRWMRTNTDASTRASRSIRRSGQRPHGPGRR